jgi:hypothetical protein
LAEKATWLRAENCIQKKAVKIIHLMHGEVMVNMALTPWLCYTYSRKLLSKSDGVSLVVSSCARLVLPSRMHVAQVISELDDKKKMAMKETWQKVGGQTWPERGMTGISVWRGREPHCLSLNMAASMLFTICFYVVQRSSVFPPLIASTCDCHQPTPPASLLFFACVLHNPCVPQVNRDFGSIFSTLLPGTQAKLEPPEGQSFLEGGWGGGVHVVEAVKQMQMAWDCCEGTKPAVPYSWTPCNTGL